MSTTIRQANHHARVSDEFRNPILVGIEQLIGVQQIQIVLDREIKEGIDRLFSSLFGNLRDQCEAALDELTVYGDVLEMRRLPQDAWGMPTQVFRPAPPTSSKLALPTSRRSRAGAWMIK